MSTRAPRLRTITIADARRGSIDAELSIEELADVLRKPARRSEPSVDEVAAKLGEVAKEMRRSTRRRDSALDEVAAELRRPTRRRGSKLDEVAAELREPTRRRDSVLDEVAAELREPTRRRDSVLDEVAAELREPTRRRDSALEDVATELRQPTRRRDSALEDVATELRQPTRRRGSTLDEVAAKLRTPRRRRGSSLAEVAAKLREPTTEARVVEGGSLDFVMPARPISMELVAGRGHYERVIAAVTQARTSVWIATANAKELMVEDARARPGRRRSMKRANYVSILSLLDELASRGVELRLLHAEIPSGPFREEIAKHPQLVGGGLALRRCPRVHMKAVIVDGELLYLGSANWTGAGLGAKGSGRRNFELGIVTDDGQLLDQVQAIYERVWRGVECEGCKLRDECPGPLAELIKTAT